MKQTLKYIYERFYEQVKYAETKHSISLTLSSALAILSSSYLSDTRSMVVILSASSIIFSLVSALYSFFALCIKKYSTKKSHNFKKGDLLSYDNVVRFGEDEYLKELLKEYPFPKGYKIDQFDRDLASQVITTAKAIKFKFTLFNYSITFLLVSLFCQAGVIILKGII